ncbi:MAG: adenylosuccinate synthase [Candidatus Eremiobacteraeota bacterium]|nr:adenylosuccinate synthase [Candidatus Eremiobacteraeota bacterium]
MRGTVTVVVGIQWGDEGKGRVVDVMAAHADIVARFGGGDNAGHTLVVGDRKLALRIVPSGVLVAETELFVGSGTVVSLAGLVKELEALAGLGIDIRRIKISDRAHVVFPYHVEADRKAEAARGSAAIGTTGRGIGPAYVDKAARAGIVFADLLERPRLVEKLRARGAEGCLTEAEELAERLAPHIVDGVAFVQDALTAGKRILAEGAQGTMLDVGFGTYPFVTSSHTIAGAATIGLGIGPTAIGRVVGIAKAYCSRVGAGPFPSELLDETGERLRTAGGEFGTVTGRPRRCGWFDAVAARYAVALNGLDAVALTKLDVLSGLERIGIVTGYRVGGRAAGVAALGEASLSTEIEWHKGWSDDVRGVRRITDLPSAARRYVARLEELLGVPIEHVSVGPERSQLAV